MEKFVKTRVLALNLQVKAVNVGDHLRSVALKFTDLFKNGFQLLKLPVIIF